MKLNKNLKIDKVMPRTFSPKPIYLNDLEENDGISIDISEDEFDSTSSEIPNRIHRRNFCVDSSSSTSSHVLREDQDSPGSPLLEIKRRKVRRLSSSGDSSSSDDINDSDSVPGSPESMYEIARFRQPSSDFSPTSPVLHARYNTPSPVRSAVSPPESFRYQSESSSSSSATSSNFSSSESDYFSSPPRHHRARMDIFRPSSSIFLNTEINERRNRQISASRHKFLVRTVISNNEDSTPEIDLSMENFYNPPNPLLQSHIGDFNVDGQLVRISDTEYPDHNSDSEVSFRQPDSDISFRHSDSEVSFRQPDSDISFRHSDSEVPYQNSDLEGPDQPSDSEVQVIGFSQPNAGNNEPVGLSFNEGEVKRAVPSVSSEITTYASNPRSPQPSTSAQALNMSSKNEALAKSPVIPRKIKKGEKKHQNSGNKRKRVPEDDEDDDDGQNCSICLEPWSNSGQHRIASLKCGHIFGKECIEKWLNSRQGSKCPQCNMKAQKKDIRILYAKAIKVIDTTEQDRLSEQLSKIRDEKTELERRVTYLMLLDEQNKQLVEKLKSENKLLKASSDLCDGEPSGISRIKQIKMVRFDSFEISKDLACRILCYNEWMHMLVVSVKNGNGIFPGCGIKKVNMFDMKVDKYVPLHQKQIKDMAFNPVKKEILLSVSLDKSAKITNVSNNSNMHVYKMENPIWSCCWKENSSSIFYVGTSSGKVIEINTSTGDQKTHIIQGTGPVMTLTYLMNRIGVHEEGLLISRLDSVYFREISSEKEHKLSVDGPFTSVFYDPESKYILVNCRPTARNPHARHILCTLVSYEISNSTIIDIQSFHTFLGTSSVSKLSKEALVATIEHNTVVLVNEHSTLLSKLYNVSNFQVIQKLNSPAEIVDCKFINVQEQKYVILLTEKRIYVFKIL